MPASGPACFNAVNRLVPLVRAETARRLVRKGLQQERIAEHLGVSQAMVSKYLRRAPESATTFPGRFVNDLVDASVQRVLTEEERGSVPAWCPVCETLSGRGLLCALQPTPGVEECLRHEAGGEANGSTRVLENLQNAADRIRRSAFAPLMPQVRSNLAMCRPSATNSRDVAAFPGRFVDVRGEVREAAPPEFGASSHLAQILLRVRRIQSQTQAILNVRYDEDVRVALKTVKLRARVLRRAAGDLVTSFPAQAELDGLIDVGAFGIEPALYLLGSSATDVVAKAERLLGALKSGGAA